ncbi:hypothetical protein MTR67_026066 [Solanum verrucosum]|uniref:Uncharacterized protein n=1 Tax=Solanum verrucosum TaxID=315347 RepID=A0AAF0R6C0_SOLVR|nr:hypothetical protein MTR67_026066 [Solanum verrucosum]
MSKSWTNSTKGQMFCPHCGHVADFTVSNIISRKFVGTPPRRKLVSRQNLRK